MTKLAIAALVLAAGSTSACAFKPWTTHAVVVPTKPPSPLRAEPGAALLVVAIVQPQGGGNGGYTVFEPDGTVVAQFEETMTGWSTMPLQPGAHRFYLRTWTSDFCMRLDAKLEPGKVYLLTLNPDLGGGGPMAMGNIFSKAAFVRPEPGKMPGGPLHSFPYVTFDKAAAGAEVIEHRDQMQVCIEKADELRASASDSSVHEGGFDYIDFAVPGK